MGNIFQKITTHSFPCQTCRRVFDRELSGSLLCPECRIYHRFNMLDYHTKHAYIIECSSYPTYSMIKPKTFETNVIICLEDPKWSKNVKDNIKNYALAGKLEKKYKMIKYIVEMVEILDILKNDLRGMCIQINSEDILFVHDQEIRETDRVLFINFDALVKKI
jgi:hypothetical protein